MNPLTLDLQEDRMPVIERGPLREEFLVVDAPGWPGGIKPHPQTEEYARAFVREHGGTLRRRAVSEWEDVDAR